MNDLRYIIMIDDAGFKINYRIRSGLFYINTLRRNEGVLPTFAHYIKPEHAIWEEWVESEGANRVRKAFRINEQTVGFFSRQGQYSSLVYKTFYGNLVAGLRDMERQYISVTQVSHLGRKGG